MPIPALVAAGAPLALRLFGGSRPRDPNIDNDEVLQGLERLIQAGDFASVRTAAAGGVVRSIPQRDGGVWYNVSFAPGQGGGAEQARAIQRAGAANLLTQYVSEGGGSGNVLPAAAIPAAAVNEPNPLLAAARKAVRAGVAAAGASAGQDIRTIGEVATERAAQGVERASGAEVRYGPFTLMQWILFGLGAGVMILLLVRRK